MKPKSCGCSAVAKPPIAPKVAGEPVDDKSGATLKAQSLALQKKSQQFGLVKVAPLVPTLPSSPVSVKPPSVPKPIPPAPPGTKPAKPCGIVSLVVECEHMGAGNKRRTTDDHQVLQIVPKAQTTTKFTADLKPVKLSGSRSSGGSDKVTYQVKTEGPGRKQTFRRARELPPSESEWKDGETRQEEIAPPVDKRLFPYPATPQRHWIYGRGCDAGLRSVAVECFPSEQFEATLDLDVFGGLVKRPNAWLKKWTEKVKIAGAKFEVTFTSPSGSGSLNWGWREHTDWRVYFFFAAKGQVKFGTLDLGLKWDLLEAAASAGLACIGIPPQVTQVLVELVDEADRNKYLGEVYAAFKLTFTASAAFSDEFKVFADDSVNEEGKTQVAGSGTLKAELKLKPGAKEFLCFGITGGGSAGLEVSGGVKFEADGVYMDPKVKQKGLNVKLVIMARAWKIEVDKEWTWQPIEESQLYPDPASNLDPPRWLLCGSSAGTAGGEDSH